METFFLRRILFGTLRNDKKQNEILTNENFEANMETRFDGKRFYKQNLMRRI